MATISRAPICATCNFAGAELVACDFSDARLDGANFAGATLDGCDVDGVDLRHVDFSKAKIIDMDIPERNATAVI